jgi:hypothetical protein
MRLSIIPLVAAIFASAIVAAPANNFHLRDGTPTQTFCDANSKAGCCNRVANLNDKVVQDLLGVLAISAGSLGTGLVGITCTFTAIVHEAYFRYTVQLHRNITLIHHIYH